MFSSGVILSKSCFKVGVISLLDQERGKIPIIVSLLCSDSNVLFFVFCALDS